MKIIVCMKQVPAGTKVDIDPETGAFGPALYSAVLYFFFQLASVSVMYQHMEDVTDVKQINRAAIFTFLAFAIAQFGLMAVTKKFNFRKSVSGYF